MSSVDICANGCVNYAVTELLLEVKCPICSSPRFRKCTHSGCKNPESCNPFLKVKHALRYPNNKRKLDPDFYVDDNDIEKEGQETNSISEKMNNTEEGKKRGQGESNVLNKPYQVDLDHIDIVEDLSEDDDMRCIPIVYGRPKGSRRRHYFAYPPTANLSREELDQWHKASRLATAIREEQYIALVSSVMGIISSTEQFQLDSRYTSERNQDLNRWLKMQKWNTILNGKSITRSKLYAVYEGIFRNNPDYDSSLFMSTLNKDAMRRHLNRHCVRSTADCTYWYNDYVKVTRASGELQRVIHDAGYIAMCEEADRKEDEEILAKVQKSLERTKRFPPKLGASRVTGTSLYRRQLEEEDRKRARKKSGPLDEESEEEFDGDYQRDLEHIVDDVSDFSEGDAEEVEQQRVAMEIREENERIQAVIAAVKKGRERVKAEEAKSTEEDENNSQDVVRLRNRDLDHIVDDVSDFSEGDAEEVERQRVAMEIAEIISEDC